MKKAVLLGIAGSNNAFSLSLYNLKAYAFSHPEIRQNWDLPVTQHPLINHTQFEVKADEMRDSILKDEPCLVAFSCYMWNVHFFQILSRKIKEATPNIKIVFGGPEMDTEHIKEGKFNELFADFCISGEGEHTFFELLKNLNDNYPTLSSISGLSYRESLDKPFTTNEKREAFDSLDFIPSPYLTGVVGDSVLFRPGVEANIETQRGCNLRCSYCIYHKDMPRISYGDIDRTINEIRYVINKGVKRIRLVDANFSSTLDHAKTIMREIISNKFEMCMMVELIPGFIDEELAQLFAEFNSMYDWNEITLGVGVQSINLNILKEVRRAIKIEKFEETFRLFQKYNIYSKIDLIIGLPGEDFESIENTLEYMMDKLKDSKAHLLCCHTMRGLPGTELNEMAQKYKMQFTSEFEPHELYESPILPRDKMLQCLRRTGVIFRLVNHSGWTNKEFLCDKRGQNISIREAFFEARNILDVSNMALVDLIIDRLKGFLSEKSYFVQDRFPYAETWWWSRAKLEVPDWWILETLQNIQEECSGVEI
jgi:radical SAM superfamily enzyme YgiQ (UPF0313 family)